ncbi:MAG: hypothetical protein KKF68_03080, partial [Nanoarchaeota archaeon]|nr:hypothetical protein [Nanoarchaeota archaeon]
MLKLKNKKGEISIIVLVVLTLMIVSATLFTFIQNSEGAQTKIYNAEFVQGFYLKQEYAEFYLKQAGENAIAKAYMEVVNSEKYLKSPVKYDPNKNVWFNSLNENLEKLFIEQFKENFREEIGNYDFKEEYLKDLKNQISEENFKIDYSKENPEVLRLVLNGLELKGSFEEMNITGSSGIFLNFD